MSHFSWIVFASAFLVSACDTKEKVQPPNYVGDYKVLATMQVSIPGQDKITNSEPENITLKYVGGDTISLTSSVTFSEPDVLATFKDSTFTLLPFRSSKTSSDVTGSGVFSKGQLTIDLAMGGFASATVNLVGRKTNDVLTDSSKLSEAKLLAKQIIENVGKAEGKEITKSQLDKRAMPLQKKLDKLRESLTPEQVVELDEYRRTLLSKLANSL